MDRYFVASGDTNWGPADSPLRLTGHFASGSPRPATLTIAEGVVAPPIRSMPTIPRAGGYSFPFSSRSTSNEPVDSRRRWRSPARPPGLQIDAADACAWIAHQLPRAPPGRTTVVFHSFVMHYLAPEERARFGELIRQHAATTGRPLARVSREPRAEDTNVMELICELWPVKQRLLLATSTPTAIRCGGSRSRFRTRGERRGVVAGPLVAPERVASCVNLTRAHMGWFRLEPAPGRTNYRWGTHAHVQGRLLRR